MGSVALLACSALPSSAGAKSLGTWEVTDGYLDQNVSWQTVSKNDDGCYTNVWNDSGTTFVTYDDVVPHQEFTLREKDGRFYSLTEKGAPVRFSGESEQRSHYNLKSHRDDPNDQCGPPIETPPDTSGCGDASPVSQPVELQVIGRHILPWGSINRGKFFNYACPSDDGYSTLPVAAPSDQSISEFKDQDVVRLHGHGRDPSPKYTVGPGAEQISASQNASISWSLTFHKIHQH
jgi:hypothetical protein